MTSKHFITNVKSPHNIDSTQIQAIEQIVIEYPYFQSAHLLLIKGLHNQQALNYSKQLRKTAIIANSRSILYHLINKKSTSVANNIDFKREEIAPIKTEDDVVKNVQQVSPVTITSEEIKVIYINTISSKEEKHEKVSDINHEVKIESDIDLMPEIELLQSIENDTDEPTQSFNEDKLNTQLQNEIERGVIRSYVETEVIKTPILLKEEQKEPISFTDWLQKIKKESTSIQKKDSKILDTHDEKVDTTLKSQENPNFFIQNKNIINKIIESDPGRIKLRTNKFFSPNTDAKQSLLENEHLVTETLAKIYALQGNNSKAIRAYEILSLKFPQKSVYFASLIEKLKTKN